MQLHTLVRSTVLCVLLGVTFPDVLVRSADTPLTDARIVWHMGSRTASENYPLDLSVNGSVRFGQELDSVERAESLRRGGDGLATVFEGGYLSLDVHRAMSVRPRKSGTCAPPLRWNDDNSFR